MAAPLGDLTRLTSQPNIIINTFIFPLEEVNNFNFKQDSFEIRVKRKIIRIELNKIIK